MEGNQSLAADQSARPEEAGLIELLARLRARVRWILGTTIATAVVAAAVVVFLVPRKYTATASVFAVESPTGATGLLQAFPFLVPQTGTSAEKFQSILNSRSVREVLVRHYGLMRLFKVRDEDRAVSALAKRTRLRQGEGGLVSVSVSCEGTPLIRGLLGSSSPSADDAACRLAADLANCYVDQLTDYLNRSLLSTAKAKRLFLEMRVEELRRELDAAQGRLTAFLSSCKVGNLDEYAQALITQAVTLEGDNARARAEGEAAGASREAAVRELSRVKERRLASSRLERDPLLDSLREQETSLELALERERLSKTEEHPDVQRLKQELTQVRDRLSHAPSEVFAQREEAVDPLYDALKQEIAMSDVQQKERAAKVRQLDQDLAALEGKIAKLPRAAGEYAGLAREVEAKGQAYGALSQELERARAQEKQESLTVERLDRAVRPLRHSSPRLLITLVYALFFAAVANLFFWSYWGAKQDVSSGVSG